MRLIDGDALRECLLSQYDTAEAGRRHRKPIDEVRAATMNDAASAVETMPDIRCGTCGHWVVHWRPTLPTIWACPQIDERAYIPTEADFGCSLWVQKRAVERQPE